VVLGVVCGVAAFFALRPLLPQSWSDAGSAELYIIGLVGTLSVLGTFVFSVMKRSGLGESPTLWFLIHVIGATLGAGMLVIHSAGNFDRPPALILAGLLALVIQGLWARFALANQLSDNFGSRHGAFLGLGANAVDKSLLAAIIEDKTAILARLDPAASEATFSPNLTHWLRSPRLSLRYVLLAKREAELIRARLRSSPALAHWRKVHIAVAGLVLLGIVVHVITVTFFAGYVADGEPITWWHLADWGG
jgi:hypothetical protein